MSKIKPVLMFVSPDFKKIVKANAGMNGMTIISYTQQLSGKLVEDFDKKKEQKKNDYWFKF